MNNALQRGGAGSSDLWPQVHKVRWRQLNSGIGRRLASHLCPRRYLTAPLVLLDGGGEMGGRRDAERPITVDGYRRRAARDRRRRCYGERGGRQRRNITTIGS